MGTWICRERCFWREKGWVEGETIEVNAFNGKKWVLDGSLWLPEEIKVIDPILHAISWCFEPLDMSELVNPMQVHLARAKVKKERTYKLKDEIEEEISLDQLSLPLPLTDKDILKIKIDGPQAVNVYRPPKKQKVVSEQKQSEEIPSGMKKGPGGRLYPK